MKKILLLLTVLPALAAAQPTVNSVTVPIGDSAIVRIFEEHPLTGFPTSGNHTWDFSAIPYSKYTDSELINIDELMEEVKEAVPELIIKPIVNPFLDRKFDGEITEEIIGLVKEWSSVRGSVRGSVWSSIWSSIWGSVRDSYFVWDSVRSSVWSSIKSSVRDSIWDSVWDSIWDSVKSSVYAYISSFFNIKYKYDFSSTIKLWDVGLVPSFDGKVWRLNSYKGVVWEGEI